MNEEVVELCLEGTVSRISGANFDDFESDQKLLHKTAFNPLRPLSAGGLLKFIFGEEFHAYNPDVVQQLQKAVKSGDYTEYKNYSEIVNTRPVAMLRDLMQVKGGVTPDPAGRGRAAGSHTQAFRLRRHVARRALARKRTKRWPKA